MNPVSDSTDIYEKTFEFINSKVETSEFEVASKTAENLLKTLPAGAAEYKTSVRCLLALGDVEFKKDNFFGAIDKYNDARVLAEKFGGMECETLVQVLFKLEAASAQLAERHKPVNISRDLLKLLGVKGEALESVLDDTVTMDQAELDRLWKQALEDAPKEVKKPLFVADPVKWLGHAYSLLCTKKVEDFLAKVFVVCGACMVMALVGQALKSVIVPLAKIEQRLEKYDGERNLTFESRTEKATLNLKPGKSAALVTRDGRNFDGPVVLYDGTFITSLQTIFACNTGPTLTFNYNSNSSLNDQSGFGFHDARGPEDNVLGRIDEIAGNVQRYIEKTGYYPDSASDSMVYFNPFSGHGERIQFFEVPENMSVSDALKRVPKPKPCTVIMFIHPTREDERKENSDGTMSRQLKGKQFELLFYQVSSFLPEYRDAMGWHSINPLDPNNILKHLPGGRLSFIICLTPLDSVTKFMSEGSRLRYALIFMALLLATLISVAITRRKNEAANPPAEPEDQSEKIEFKTNKIDAPKAPKPEPPRKGVVVKHGPDNKLGNKIGKKNK